MNKKRRIQLRRCESKVSHNSKAAAIKVMNKTLERHFIFHKLMAYKCKYCGKWHIGKTNTIVYNRFEELNK